MKHQNLGIGDWGLGIGDWGLGIGRKRQSPIPNPQSPISKFILNLNINYNKETSEKYFIYLLIKL